MGISNIWNRIINGSDSDATNFQTMNKYLVHRLGDSWLFVCFLRNGMIIRFATTDETTMKDALVLNGISAIVMPNGKTLEGPESSAVDLSCGRGSHSGEGEPLQDSLRASLFGCNRGMVVRLNDIVAICEGDS